MELSVRMLIKLMLKLCIDRKVEDIKLEDFTEDFFTKTKKKLADLEKRSRWNNQRFDGCQEETNDIWEEIESIITDVMKEK